MAKQLKNSKSVEKDEVVINIFLKRNNEEKTQINKLLKANLLFEYDQKQKFLINNKFYHIKSDKDKSKFFDDLMGDFQDHLYESTEGFRALNREDKIRRIKYKYDDINFIDHEFMAFNKHDNDYNIETIKVVKKEVDNLKENKIITPEEAKELTAQNYHLITIKFTERYKLKKEEDKREKIDQNIVKAFNNIKDFLQKKYPYIVGKTYYQRSNYYCEINNDFEIEEKCDKHFLVLPIKDEKKLQKIKEAQNKAKNVSEEVKNIIKNLEKQKINTKEISLIANLDEEVVKEIKKELAENEKKSKLKK